MLMVCSECVQPLKRTPSPTPPAPTDPPCHANAIFNFPAFRVSSQIKHFVFPSTLSASARNNYSEGGRNRQSDGAERARQMDKNDRRREVGIESERMKRKDGEAWTDWDRTI